MDHLQSHVCGSLPVTQLFVFVNRCHHHEAWTVRVEVRQQREEDPAILAETFTEFGPFDSMDSVGRSIAAELRSALDVVRTATIVS